jgi:hypothetical protein
VIGPLTYVGWLAVFAVIALWVAMARFGRRGQLALGAAFTLPFIMLLAYIEFTTIGPPLWADPYGYMMIAIVMGPIFLGWAIYFFAFLTRKIRKAA